MWENLVLATGLAATAILSALGGLILLTALRLRAGPDPRPTVFREGEDATVFLFDGDRLVDATPSGYRFLSGSHSIDDPWIGLLERLSPRFDNLAGRLAQVAVTGSLALMASAGHPLALRAETRGGLMTIRLIDMEQYSDPLRGDILSAQALDHELQDLRDATNAAPFPIWRTLANGDIVWANAAYMEMVAHVASGSMMPSWPLPTIFAVSDSPTAQDRWALRCTGPAGMGKVRVSLSAATIGGVTRRPPFGGSSRSAGAAR